MKDTTKGRAENHIGAVKGTIQGGTLHIVSTPLGNLADITLRALEVLRNTAIIAAENVSHTKGLCRHYGITTPVRAYNQHNRKAVSPGLVEQLKSGRDIALVTDAGTPGISDPGIHLVDRALSEGIRVTPIPGPSAVSAALSVSGLPAEEFVFLGFLPNKAGKRRKRLRELALESRTMVFFEAPRRLSATLEDIRDTLGNRTIVFVREMTKAFEEVRKGSTDSVLESLGEEPVKGECTLVVSGRTGRGERRTMSDEGVKKMQELLSAGRMSTRDIARFLSNDEDLPYRKIYKECIAEKEKIERAGVNGVDKEP